MDIHPTNAHGVSQSRSASESHPRWTDLTSFANIHAAWRAAARGKRRKAAVTVFELNLEAELLGLRAELLAGTYQPGGYANFPVHEAKRRLISAAPFRDRVVHHALMRLLEPALERRFIGDSYANRRGKGTHLALDRCSAFMRRYRYALPLDVRQFFPSIDHELLKGLLRRIVREPELRALCDLIIDSGRGVLDKEYDMVYFAGDDLLAAQRPRGLPIGNLTSQHWANLYLNEVDQFAKRHLHCQGYLRYVDDMLIFADDKATLWQWRSALLAKLATLRLTAHEVQAQPRPCAAGLPYLGFQVYPTHRRLKRRNVVAVRGRLRALTRAYAAGEVSADAVTAAVRGWVNHARYGDTWGLRGAVLRGVVLRRSDSDAASQGKR